MWDGPPEVIDLAAEAVAQVDSVNMPTDPVEGSVVAAAIRAEGQSANLCFSVVWVVDAHESCAQAS